MARLNNPLHLWTGTHPHCLQRIANVKHNTLATTFKSGFTCKGVNLTSKGELQQQLQEYQRSADWVDVIGVAAESDDESLQVAAKADGSIETCFDFAQLDFDRLMTVRRASRHGVDLFVQDQVGKRYRLITKVVAIILTFVYHLSDFITYLQKHILHQWCGWQVVLVCRTGKGVVQSAVTVVKDNAAWLLAGAIIPLYALHAAN